MSKKTKQDVPPMEPFEKNLSEEPYTFVLGREYEVCSWRPGPAHSAVPCTQVHLMVTLMEPSAEGPGAKLVMRLKSPRALDELVGVLLQHRKDVWGDK